MPASILRALLGAAALLTLSASTASAASTLKVETGPDPTEEVPVPIKASWSTSEESHPTAYVTRKPAGQLGCGPNYSADAPNSTDVIIDSGAATDSHTVNQTFDEPGDYTLCGYLQRGGNDDTPLAKTGPVTVNVRGARASIGLTLPPRVDPGQTYTLAVHVNAELHRNVYVTVKPAGGRGCEPNYAADAPQSTDVLIDGAQGDQTLQRNVSAGEENGRFLLCGYVQESGNDTAPEATTSAEFEVAPDPCVVARAARDEAQSRLDKAKAAVKRWRKRASRERRRARRTHGRAHRTHLKKARRADKKRSAAARRAATATTDLGARENDVRNACGTP